MADKRGEMAEAWVNRAATPEQLKPGYRLEYEAFIAGFDAGAEQMRERIESVFASELEDATNAEFRLESDRLTVRAWLMNARARIRALTPEASHD